MNRIPSESLSIMAWVSGYALLGCSPSVAQPVSLPTNLRSSVPLSTLAQTWGARRLLEETQMDWENAQKLAHIGELQDLPLEEWEIMNMLEGMACVPPEGVTPVQMVITGIKEGQPHRVTMEESDYDFEFLDSIRGNL